MSTKTVVSAQAIENDSLAYSEVTALPKQAVKAHVKTVVFAGPRPSEFPGDGWKNESFFARARKYTSGYVKYLLDKGYKRVVIGANLGFEQFVLEACIALGIKPVVIAPYRDFDKKWTDETRTTYKALLERTTVVYASEVLPPPKGLDQTKWAIACLVNRNQIAVNEGDLFVMVGDNKQTGYMRGLAKGKRIVTVDVSNEGFKAHEG